MLLTHEINDFADLHSVLKNYRGKGRYMFRGQADCGWDLIPKAGRLEYVSENDLMMFNSWSRRARAYMRDLPESPWGRLAIAQHSGLATRLLDWSLNPLVAVFFAISELPETDAAVYCLNALRERRVVSEKDSFSDIECTSIYVPPAYIQRIVGQWGRFTYHPDKTTSLDGEDPSRDEWLSVIIIPAKAKPQLRHDLNFYGINDATLFPDLDGISRYLNWWSRGDTWSLYDEASGPEDGDSTIEW